MGGIICRFVFTSCEGKDIIRIYGKTKDQIERLFARYNRDYDSGKVEGEWLMYLRDKKIKFDENIFEVDMEV